MKLSFKIYHKLKLILQHRKSSTIANKPLAIMAGKVKTQASALRKNISDYPRCSELKSATIASGKTLPAIAARLQVTGARLRRGLGADASRQHLTARLVSFPQYALKCIGETTPTARPLAVTLTDAHRQK